MREDSDLAFGAFNLDSEVELGLSFRIQDSRFKIQD
ncbi:MAG: hypothetical protein RL095_879 [Verrucomicrobiota bacterium]|jgi:hypothetical protein